ncbi:MAG: hypothetical protein ACXAD7_08470, partial [Candidatus Kariarchaeaceae archaeon]
GSLLNELFPEGSTLDIQMMLSFLLFEISKLHGKPGGETGFENKDPIRFIYFLLLKTPFKKIFS